LDRARPIDPDGQRPRIPELQQQIGVGADTLDQLHPRCEPRAVARLDELDMLRPDAQGHRPIGEAVRRHAIDRQIERPPEHALARLGFEPARKQVHRRAAHECRDEDIRRCGIDRGGLPTCWTIPRCITTIRLAMVMASTWSWVT
jgi:hypothetical protein